MTGLRGPARVGRNEGLIEAPVILNRVLCLISGLLFQGEIDRHAPRVQ